MYYAAARIAVGIGCLLLIVEPRPSRGASFSFDLTNALGPDFNSAPETEIDLEVAFSSVDSAAAEISGVFTLGLVTRVTVPEHTGPVIPNDTVNLIVRVGEVGTAWIDKNAYAIQDLQGHSGAVTFILPLQGSVSTTDPIPVLLPSGDLVPDYSFLLDGRFGIAAGSTHWLASIYQVVESPRFELTEFVLRVEGTAVPEPATGACGLVAILGIVIGHRRRLALRRRGPACLAERCS